MTWLSRKMASLVEVTVEQLADIAGFLRYGTAAGSSVSVKSSVEVTAVLCAARVIAEGLAQVPVRVLDEEYREGKLFRSVFRDHWAHRLLAVKPNSWQTSFEFREYLGLAAVLDRGFLGIKNVVGGEVREILPIPMGAWSVVQNPDWSLEFHVTHVNNAQSVFSPDQVFHVRGPTLNGYAAISAVQAAREAIGLSAALEKQQGRLSRNGGKPSGVLSFKEKLRPETITQLKEDWNNRFGPDGDGGVAILDGDATFSPMTMTSVDAQHIETRRHQIEEIARAFRVMPIMLMHSDKASTYASAEQMFRHHVIHTLAPWFRRFEEAATRDILDNVTGLRVDLDERGLLRGDFTDQADYYTKALGAGGQPGWMTPNEIRAERDMNPVDEDWADKVPRGAMTTEGEGDGTQAPAD